MRRPRLVPDDTKIPFFRYRWIAFAWSLFVLVGTIILVADQRPQSRHRLQGRRAARGAHARARPTSP